MLPTFWFLDLELVRSAGLILSSLVVCSIPFPPRELWDCQFFEVFMVYLLFLFLAPSRVWICSAYLEAICWIGDWLPYWFDLCNLYEVILFLSVLIGYFFVVQPVLCLIWTLVMVSWLISLSLIAISCIFCFLIYFLKVITRCTLHSKDHQWLPVTSQTK